MPSFLVRQFSGFVVPSAQTNPSADQNFIWQTTDSPYKYILELPDGSVQHDIIQVAASGGTATLVLPNAYVNTALLFALILTDTTIKATTIFAAPLSVTSNQLIMAGANQQGIASWLGNTTSITLTNTQTGVATVEYLLYMQPDITQASSWRSGSQITGISNPSDATPPGWV